MMKTRLSIAIILPAALVLASCSSSLYTSAEYDDLYYTPADAQRAQEVAVQQEQYYAANENQAVAEQTVPDTLQAEQYNAEGVDANLNEDMIEYQESNVFDYYGQPMYASRLRSFHYPMRIARFYRPFYTPFYTPYYSYTNFYDPYDYYNPWMYEDYYFNRPFYSSGYNYFSPYYNPMYANYYSGFYSGLYYSSWYPSYYGYGGYNYRVADSWVNTRSRPRAGVPSTSRRMTTSTPATKSNVQVANSRRTGSGTVNEQVSTSRRTGTSVVQPVRSRTATNSAVASQNRRVSTNTRNTAIQPVYKNQNSGTTNRRTVTSIPRYNSNQRAYQPTYTKPRTTTKPAYNSRTNTNRIRSSNIRRSTISNPASVSRGSSITMPTRRSVSTSRSTSTYRGSTSKSSSSVMRSSSGRSSSSSSSSGRRSGGGSSSSGRRR